jgi:hypothetical protein
MAEKLENSPLTTTGLTGNPYKSQPVINHSTLYNAVSLPMQITIFNLLNGEIEFIFKKD